MCSPLAALLLAPCEEGAEVRFSCGSVICQIMVQILILDLDVKLNLPLVFTQGKEHRR